MNEILNSHIYGSESVDYLLLTSFLYLYPTQSFFKDDIDNYYVEKGLRSSIQSSLRGNKDNLSNFYLGEYKKYMKVYEENLKKSEDKISVLKHKKHLSFYLDSFFLQSSQKEFDKVINKCSDLLEIIGSRLDIPKVKEFLSSKQELFMMMRNRNLGKSEESLSKEDKLLNKYLDIIDKKLGVNTMLGYCSAAYLKHLRAINSANLAHVKEKKNKIYHFIRSYIELNLDIDLICSIFKDPKLELEFLYSNKGDTDHYVNNTLLSCYTKVDILSNEKRSKHRECYRTLLIRILERLKQTTSPNDEKTVHNSDIEKIEEILERVKNDFSITPQSTPHKQQYDSPFPYTFTPASSKCSTSASVSPMKSPTKRVTNEGQSSSSSSPNKRPRAHLNLAKAIEATIDKQGQQGETSKQNELPRGNMEDLDDVDQFQQSKTTPTPLGGIKR